MLSKLKYLHVYLYLAAVGGCDLLPTARCMLTDIQAALRSPTASARGSAAECALRQSPADKARLVPEMLMHLNDDTPYRSYYASGGIIGFGEAGMRELSLGQIAMRTIQTAQPEQANIEPIVRTLVATANKMRSLAYNGAFD